jgi:hypothetical protein
VNRLARKKPNPADSLSRFMIGIYDYYVDRGMPKETAKARMIDNAFDECVKLMKAEEEIPDHMLVIMAQFMSRALNNRGAQITRLIKEHQEKSTYQEKMLQPLHDLKPAKDAIDRFIETYKGWSDLDGTKEKK